MYSSYPRDNTVEDQCTTSLKETFKYLNKDELQAILDDDQKLTEMIYALPQVFLKMGLLKLK